MLLFMFILSTLLIGGNLEEQNNPDKFERWFTQNLDHFNPNDERTWLQRYFVNSQFSNELRNIAFLNIWGECEADSQWMERGAWIEYAKHFQAICFQLEHRFYGRSHPTNDLSNENLEYLSSQQALSDSAFFIESMNKEYNLSSHVKWISFGCSYAGSLSAWLRELYPHLVHGAVSSSGPLLAKLDFSEFYKTIADNLKTYSDECYMAVKSGMDQVEFLTQSSIGQNILNSFFKLCTSIEKSINTPNDISLLFYTLASYFVNDNYIPRLCHIMTDLKKEPEVARLAKVNSMILMISNNECLSYQYNVMIDVFKDTSWENLAYLAYGIERQWMYQTCTEFGFYQTSEYKPHIFGDKFPLNFYIKRCQDIFGPHYNKTFLENAVYKTNALYGGLNITASNVVFVHGSFDPWKNLGITKTNNNNTTAILIKGFTHCALYSSSASSNPELEAARIEIQQLIGAWLDV